MEVYIHPNNKKNIGDDLNLWFWNEALGQAVYSNESHLLVGIGTVLNDRLPKNKIIHVLGSGAGYGRITQIYDWNIHFVRGFLTAETLRCDKSLVISDPAILISKFRPQSLIKKHKISFMPHVNIDSEKYKSFITQLGWNYISPSGDEMSVLSEIASSERLITSTMHGAIISDSYRTPWLPVSTSPEILLFKWKDWFSSLDLDIRLTELPPMWPEEQKNLGGKLKEIVKRNILESNLKKLERNGQFFLSNPTTLASKQQQLIEKIGNIKNEFMRKEVS